MHSSRFVRANGALALFFLVLSACSSKVNLGGPQSGDENDSGGRPTTSGGDASASSDDATTPATSPDAEADAGPLQDLNQAESYATGDVACTTAADCCVAFDGCMNLGLVVGAADQDKVASLLLAYDQAESQQPNARCTGCVPPPVQVACVESKCVGTVVGAGDLLPDGALVDPSFMQNHCGTLPGAPATFDAGPPILGC